jgi:hypothetical protein
MSDPLATMSRPPAVSLWDVMEADPSNPLDRDVLRLVIRDQRCRSRALLYPWIRVLSRAVVTLIVVSKRACPVTFSAHATMDRLCLWFLRRFVSPTAVTLLIRHFIVETNLLNFCARNALTAADPLDEVSLRPTTLADLGNRAVIEHDLNVYRVLFSLGCHVPAEAALGPGPGASLDFGMLDVPAIDPEAHTRRLLNLDIQTALCLMNIPFAACLTPSEYRRAVHSLRLDYSLLSILAAVTGDSTFLSWRLADLPVRVDSNVDVPLRVYAHAVLCECAHARLCQLRDGPVSVSHVDETGQRLDVADGGDQADGGTDRPACDARHVVVALRGDRAAGLRGRDHFLAEAERGFGGAGVAEAPGADRDTGGGRVARDDPRIHQLTARVEDPERDGTASPSQRRWPVQAHDG